MAKDALFAGRHPVVGFPHLLWIPSSVIRYFWPEISSLELGVAHSTRPGTG